MIVIISVSIMTSLAVSLTLAFREKYKRKLEDSYEEISYLNHYMLRDAETIASLEDQLKNAHICLELALNEQTKDLINAHRSLELVLGDQKNLVEEDSEPT